MEAKAGEIENNYSGVDLLDKLKNVIKQLKEFNQESKFLNKEKESEFLKKESSLLSKIVNYFQLILSDNFIIKEEQNLQSSDNKENKNCFWYFISKHFNTPVVGFCKMFEKNENNSENSSIQKAKNWIYFSILEKTFLDSIYEIFIQELHEIYYEENAIIRKYKFEIINSLEDLQQIQFINIKSKDYEKYLVYLKQNNKYNNEEKKIEDLKIIESPIWSKKKLLKQKKNSTPKNDELIINFQQSEFFKEEDFIDFFEDSKTNLQHLTEEYNENEFKVKKYADFSPNIVNNFYTFIQKEEIKIKESQSNELENIISNKNSISFIEEENNLSNHNEKIKKSKSGVILNPKITIHLPTDNLYSIKDRNCSEEILYKNKLKPISNCLSLYLEKFYKKAPYHKIYKHNLNNKPITLKSQNYQCYTCLKRIHMLFNIPLEPVFWCSYYMRYVCKNCIDYEYSIIPHFICDDWNFEKFSISKKGKNILEKWYDKPIIIFNKNDKLLKKISQLNKVIKTKKVINNIFHIIKCENKFKLINQIFGEYDYLALKEIIFSIRDLVEINNKSFINKINNFKDVLSLHISGECDKCKFEGQICDKCHSQEILFFYKNDEVLYCKKQNKSYHKKCIEYVGHVH